MSCLLHLVSGPAFIHSSSQYSSNRAWFVPLTHGMTGPQPWLEPPPLSPSPPFFVWMDAWVNPPLVTLLSLCRLFFTCRMWDLFLPTCLFLDLWYFMITIYKVKTTATPPHPQIYTHVLPLLLVLLNHSPKYLFSSPLPQCVSSHHATAFPTLHGVKSNHFTHLMVWECAS